MKLIKIGKSQSCNIVMPSNKVSSLHAEMLILDTGEIFIEDKNSTNGTFIGNEKIPSNTEVPVRRGDYVRFADTELNWAYVPAPDKRGNFASVINIGTHHRNDIVINGTFASRFHAVLKIDKKGKAYIRDAGSRNGTIVNGAKIDANKDVRIKAGDSVICGDTDITQELRQYIPNTFGWVKPVAIALAAIAIIVGAGFLVSKFMSVNPQTYRPAVVYVRACYHYEVKLEDNPMPELWDASFPLSETPYQATAFFVDNEGRLATNRHVALPWDKDYRSEETDNRIKSYIHNELERIVPVNEVRNEVDLELLSQSPLGYAIVRYSKAMSSTSSEFLRNVKTTIRRIKNSPLSISGEMDYITVGYPGRNYTHEDEFERCYVLAASDTYDKDIALLQLNSKKTPSDIKDIFNVKDFYMGKIEPLKEQYYTIGYPRGLSWALDDRSHSLEPEIREVKCGKLPSIYTFEIQCETLGGASGSPIFDKKGRLVGVLWGGWSTGVTYGHACHAKHLKELYDKAVTGL